MREYELDTASKPGGVPRETGTARQRDSPVHSILTGSQFVMLTVRGLRAGDHS